MPYTFIEVCSGCGGMSSGFMKAGFTPLLLNEIDKTCCQTLRTNHPNVTINNEDMRKLDLSSYQGKVDVLMGGVPCQSFSQAGKRKGLDDDRGGLIMRFKEMVDVVKPKVFVVENVKGLVSHEGGATLRKIIEDFSSSEKYIIKFKVLNAMNYEVPQKRERIIIVGVRKDIGKDYSFPLPVEKRLVLKDVLVDCPESSGYKYPEKKLKIMRLIPQGGCWIDLPETIQKEYMGKSLKSGGGKRGIARRLSMNEPSLTLTTSPCQKQTERCHPTETRPLTVREYARIQTFPDSYSFSGSMAQQYKQIGNAVPVMLAYHIALSVLNTFRD